MGCTDHVLAIAPTTGAARPQENTLSSFKAALTAPVLADWIETDLIRTHDDRIVLIHSTEIAQHVALAHRPSDTLYIDDLNFDQIGTLKLGPDGSARIPALQELIALVGTLRPESDADLVLNLEIKDVQDAPCPRRQPTLGSLALQELSVLNFPLQRVRFSSFSLEAIADLGARAPQARLGMLFNVLPHEYSNPGHQLFSDSPEQSISFTPQNIATILARVPQLEALHPEIQTLTPATVALAARHHLAIATWAWFEESPLQSAKFAAATRQALDLCQAADVPLTFITDHIVDLRRFTQDYLKENPSGAQPRQA